MGSDATIAAKQKAIYVTVVALSATLLIMAATIWIIRYRNDPSTRGDATAKKAPPGNDGRQRPSVTSPEQAQANQKQDEHLELLANIPGTDPRPIERSLATALEKLDVAADSWPVEKFNQLAAQQLKELARFIADRKFSDTDQLEPLVTSDFHCQPLRPPDLAKVFADSALVVWRSAGPDEEVLTSTYRGAKGMAAAIEVLLAPMDGVSAVEVDLKVTKVELTRDIAVTNVAFHTRGKRISGIVQQNASWECEWTTTADKARPLLRSVQVTDFEEVVPSAETAVLFSDCTGAVLGKNRSFITQLVYGVDHWRRMMEASFHPDLSGFQGVSVGDVNGDGFDDVYICQQGGLPNRLFVQRSDGTLSDISASAGVDYLELTSSALLIDLDNDDDQDIVLATLSSIVFLANDGSAKFTVVHRVDSPAALQSLTAADYDEDGDLDIYACGYTSGGQLWAGEAGGGIPVPYFDANNGGPNILLRNNDDFRFANVTEEVGLDVNNRRFSFAASWEDYDNDGDLDLYVANDFGRNNLYRNDDGRFVDQASALGVEDMASGMSACWGDYNSDGWMDLYVSNMYSSAGGRIAYQRQFLPSAADDTRQRVRRFARGNTLFQNRGDGAFLDLSVSAGVNNGHWAWASKFADINNDGREDLLVANGFITHRDTGDL